MSNIGPFKLYNNKPSDICYGSIYTLEVNIPLLYYPKRTVRVFLPEDFDFNQKYPVLFMSDGQNIVDKYTSAFGAWEIDKRQHELLAEGYKSFIVVGIDCPVGPLERAMEYSFPFIKMNNVEEGRYLKDKNLEFESHLLFQWIARELLPLIRKYFPISDDRKNVAAGGSSMGGVFALSLVTYYPELFGFALSFSPGIFLYNKKDVKNYLDKAMENFDKNHKIYLYSGNVGFESKFLERTKDMFEYFSSKGFDEKHLKLCVDLKAEHCERCWSEHFNNAIKFWQE